MSRVHVTMHDAPRPLPGDVPQPAQPQPYDAAAARALLAQRREQDQRTLEGLNAINRLQNNLPPLPKDR